MNKFDFAAQAMTHSYSSASNESEQNVYQGQLIMATPGNDFFFDLSSSFESNNTVWPVSPSSPDEFNTSSLPVDLSDWSSAPGESPTFDFVPPYTIPIPRSNPRMKSQCLEAHSFDEAFCYDDAMIPTHTSYTSDPRVRSASPPSDKPSRSSCLCETCGKSFTRVADVRRHQATVHFPKLSDCPSPRCPRKGKNGLTRRDHLIEHLRSYHHMQIPKRTPKRAPGKRKLRKGDIAGYYAAA